MKDRGSSPIIYKDHVYTLGGHKAAVCIELSSGKVIWSKKMKVGEISSPLLADGKLFHRDQMLKPTADDCKILATAKLGMVNCTSPAFADGKLFLRVKEGIVCFDLRK
jgi:outer membrane protein assembly factor BamB